MPALTKAQRTRLDKLATYLEGLPEDYRHFRMDEWVMSFDRAAMAQYALENGGVASCGTAACAAGHGPAAGILVPKHLVRSEGKDSYVDWENYCDLFVGGDELAKAWCFNGAWALVDDHHWGAAARIRYLLAKGWPPEDFMCPRWQGIQRRFRAFYAPYRIDARDRDGGGEAGQTAKQAGPVGQQPGGAAASPNPEVSHD